MDVAARFKLHDLLVYHDFFKDLLLFLCVELLALAVEKQLLEPKVSTQASFYRFNNVYIDVVVTYV